MNTQLPPNNQSTFNYFNGVRVAYVVVDYQHAPLNSRKILFPAAFVLSGDKIDNAQFFLRDDADQDDCSQNCVGGAPAVEC